MYFVPILLALATMLVYPSVLLGVAVGALAWLYLAKGGSAVGRNRIDEIRTQLAYRVLSVKLLAVSGRLDDETYRQHGVLTVDYADNSQLRGSLRDCAGGRPDGWEDSAKLLRSVFRKEPKQLSDRLRKLILQIAVQPGGLEDASQIRLMEIAKVWNLGPKHVRGLFEE